MKEERIQYHVSLGTESKLKEDEMIELVIRRALSEQKQEIVKLVEDAHKEYPNNGEESCPVMLVHNALVNKIKELP